MLLSSSYEEEEATKWADNNSDFSNSKNSSESFFLRQFAKKRIAFENINVKKTTTFFL